MHILVLLLNGVNAMRLKNLLFVYTIKYSYDSYNYYCFNHFIYC